jgi:hypothetical protein
MMNNLHLAEPVPALELVTGDELNAERYQLLQDNKVKVKVYYGDHDQSFNLHDLYHIPTAHHQVVLEYWTVAGRITFEAVERLAHNGATYDNITAFMLSMTAVQNAPHWVVIDYDATRKNIEKRYIMSAKGMVFFRELEQMPKLYPESN